MNRLLNMTTRGLGLLVCGGAMLQFTGCGIPFAIRDGFFGGITNTIATIISTTLLNLSGTL